MPRFSEMRKNSWVRGCGHAQARSLPEPGEHTRAKDWRQRSLAGGKPDEVTFSPLTDSGPHAPARGPGSEIAIQAEEQSENRETNSLTRWEQRQSVLELGKTCWEWDGRGNI